MPLPMSTIDLQAVKGTRDFYPDDMRLRTWLFGLWREVAAQYGFEEYDSCVLESEELYIRKAGDEITDQLYNFIDKGGRRVALRPEITPSLARMVMAKGTSLPLPARWFAIAQCFRYENMQRGRKREHFQWNMDVIGLASEAAEAELMAAQCAFLRATGLSLSAEKCEVVIKVSNRQVIQHFLEGLGITGDAFAAVCVIIDKHDKIGRDATIHALAGLGIAPEAAGRILEILAVTGLSEAAAIVGPGNPGISSLSRLISHLADFGIAHCARIDLSVIRGLSYYTGCVWEVFDASGSLPRAIAGGGRYDRLIESFGGTPVPMVGFGFGDVVISEILSERGLIPASVLARGIDDVVYPMSAAEFPVANQLARALRAQGRKVAVDYSERRFKHVVKRAEDDGAKRLLVLGMDEVKNRRVTVRQLGKERVENSVPLSELGVAEPA